MRTPWSAAALRSETAHRQEADAAFSNAIFTGRLSLSELSPRYAGDYMFMGKDQSGHDTFKHRMTRQYLPLSSLPFPIVETR